MANTASIEVWHKILKYAISVPGLFEVDPITTGGLESLPQYRFSVDYWESERTRNSLRRVCHSWDAFLRPYDHRFVRLSDVYFGDIPVIAVTKAIRLNIEPELRDESDIIGVFSGHSRALLAAVDLDRGTGTVKPWKVEILDGITVMGSERVSRLLDRTPALRAVAGAMPEYLKVIRQKVPGLQALYTEKGFQRTPMDCFSTLSGLRHLTTLHLVSISMEPPVERCRLPALQHLSISSFSPDPSEEQFRDKMLEIARALGENLRTLHYQHLTPNCLVPHEMWSHIPCVDDIQIPCWMDTSPPADHPTRHVTISVRSLQKYMTQNIPFPDPGIQKHLPRSSQFVGRNVIVKMDVTWFLALMVERTRHILLSIWLASHYRDSEVKFTDSEGVTLEEYLIFVIQTYWRDGRAKRVRHRHRKLAIVQILVF